jgi:hypothetical protein
MSNTKKLLRFGSAEPSCERCGTTEIAMLCRVTDPGKASQSILCRNCKGLAKMITPKALAQKARRFEAVGYSQPACVICNDDTLQILELDHVANEANSDFLAPLCANHHAVKSHGAETGPMAALRLRDPARRALVLQAACEFGIGAILAMVAAWDGSRGEMARALLLGAASAGLMAWGAWNIAADARLADAHGDDYDRTLPAVPAMAMAVTV